MSFFLTRWLKAVAEWIEDLFDAAEKAWDKLEPEVQEAIITASSIVSTISENINLAPEELWDAIEKRIPFITKERFQIVLNESAAVLNIPVDTSLLKTIENIQIYIASKNEDIGKSILAQTLAIFLSPNNTPFAKIVMLVEFAYRKFVKK